MGGELVARRECDTFRKWQIKPSPLPRISALALTDEALIPPRTRDETIAYMRFLGGGSLDENRMLSFVDRSPEAEIF